MAKRVLVAAASAFVAVNIWTGAPLLALWVGSHLVSQTTLSMRGVVIVVAVLATVVFSMTWLLSRLNGIYLDMVHRSNPIHRSPWLTQSGGEVRRWAVFTLVERVVVVSVYLAVLALLVWFFFLAGSPIPE
jgi:hypothetical protein